MESNYKYCPKCREIDGISNSFCRFDGTKLKDTPVICSGCSNQLYPQDLYCPHCGVVLTTQ